MNDRLNELTKQIQDAIAEIKETLPVIGDGSDWFQLLEEDFYEHFQSYFRKPIVSDYYRSEVYTTINGVMFCAVSRIEMPAGVDKVCVANPEREAV